MATEEKREIAASIDNVKAELKYWQRELKGALKHKDINYQDELLRIINALKEELKELKLKL